jgi:hypothetical protein
MNSVIFWNIGPFSPYLLSSLKKEVVRNSEASVYLLTTWRYIQKMAAFLSTFFVPTNPYFKPYFSVRGLRKLLVQMLPYEMTSTLAIAAFGAGISRHLHDFSHEVSQIYSLYSLRFTVHQSICSGEESIYYV